MQSASEQTKVTDPFTYPRHTHTSESRISTDDAPWDWVALYALQAYNRIFGSAAPKVAATPEAELIKMQQEKAAKEEEEAKNAPPKEKKAGSWGGL